MEKIENLFLSAVEAQKYLNLDDRTFTFHTEKSGIRYILHNGEKKYTKANLDRFRKEVLTKGVKHG